MENYFPRNDYSKGCYNCRGVDKKLSVLTILHYDNSHPHVYKYVLPYDYVHVFAKIYCTHYILITDSAKVEPFNLLLSHMFFQPCSSMDS